MGTQQTDGLNWDQDTKYTMGYFGNRGDATSNWYVVVRAFNGGIVPLGAVSDAAATTGDGTVIALLKGLRGFFKREDDPHANNDYGMPAWYVRNDGLGANIGSNGDYGPLSVGQGGEVFTTPTPPQNATTAAAVALSSAASTALAASLVIKASAGTLYKLDVLNTNVADQVIQLYNSASLPSDGAVPAIVLKVKTGEHKEFNWRHFGRRFTTGIVVGNSSTVATKTIGAADCWFNAEYK